MNISSQRGPAFRLGVIILAAGSSTRMGQPKLLLPWGKTTVIGHLLAQWRELGAQQIGVVTAAGDARLERELDRLAFGPEQRIANPAPQRGMFSSIQCAASWPAWEPGLTHWALSLGDQPHLKMSTLAGFLEFALTHPLDVCQPAFQGRPRHPVLFPRRVFEALAVTRVPDLKTFLHREQVDLNESDDAGLELDIDRPEDYQKALRLMEKSGAGSQGRGAAGLF